ncbi:MAG TPA: ABC transporter ATP-binding protein [Pyrinomonadaceae bacterium]|nr:ABC transporter ATP-binding protein [Pyrinomonadaceae bacterium]
MHTALRVDGLAKQYRIYDKPADRLKELLTRGHLKRHREFWALKHISFEITPGTTTGIIGPNGSGKSTLLQIIAGTLNPTHGSVHVNGRIGALLELGAGFNLEFTGIENVYMNSALMGFSKAETTARLREIERFAELGEFIHQPVKTYSSGMFVRLAFAIAVNSDPDILIVDEALSVGDTIFQHRCVRRIKEMQEGGTTILFVSHEPTLVRALCSRAILLYQGEMLADGAPVDVLNRYQRLIMAREKAYDDSEGAPVAIATESVPTYAEQSTGVESIAARDKLKFIEQRGPLHCQYRHGNNHAEVLDVEFLNAADEPIELVDSGEAVKLRFRFVANQDLREVVCGFMIRNRHGINIYGTNTEQRGFYLGVMERGKIKEATFTFNCSLGQEHYFISVAVHSPDGVAYDWLDGVVFFRVACPIEMEGLANLNANVNVRECSINFSLST